MIQVSAMVERSLTLANQTFEASEVLEKAKIWTDELIGIVPLSRLPECFSVAKQRHDSSFAINCYEVLAAWRLIQDMQEASEQRNAVDIPKTNCDLEHDPDYLADELVWLGTPTKGYKLLPCPNCRPDSFRQRQCDLARETELKTDKQIVNDRLDELKQIRAQIENDRLDALAKLKAKIVELRPEPLDL